MENKKERAKSLYKYLKYNGLVSTQDDLAKKIKYNRVSVAKALNGYEDYLTRDFANAINTTFGNIIDIDWLLTGEGEMLKSISKDERGTEDTDEAITLTAENGLIYYYDMVATASDIEDLTDNELNQPYVTLYIPGYEKCVGFNVAGDSMLPTAKHRDIVAIERKKVETIINGEIYFIVTRDGQRMIKRLVQLGKDEDGTMMFRCISDNPNQDLYAPFVISGDRIHTISRVKGFISHLQLG